MEKEEEEVKEGFVLVARKGCFGLPRACSSCLPVYLYLRFANVDFDLRFNLVHPDSGDKALYDMVSPFLDIMGKSRFYLGDVGNATAMKLMHDGLFSKGLLLSEKVGQDPKILVKVVSQGAISAPMFSLKGPSMVQSKYPTAFPLKLQSKYPTAFPLKHQQKVSALATRRGHSRKKGVMEVDGDGDNAEIGNDSSDVESVKERPSFGKSMNPIRNLRIDFKIEIPVFDGSVDAEKLNNWLD
ncbi:hypothetical protein GIB67_000029, partial [Kingdonia uniflora]